MVTDDIFLSAEWNDDRGLVLSVVSSFCPFGADRIYKYIECVSSKTISFFTFFLCRLHLYYQLQCTLGHRLPYQVK